MIYAACEQKGGAGCRRYVRVTDEQFDSADGVMAHLKSRGLIGPLTGPAREEGLEHWGDPYYAVPYGKSVDA